MENRTSNTKTFIKNRRSSLISAIFLMATSAIGPSFITQTATFTVTLGCAFGFGILASIIIDFVVQQNIWRVVSLTKMYSSDIANATIPYSGYVLAILVIFGGLVFNIGNIAGAGLGLNALVGLDPKWSGVISAFMAIYIFSSHKASHFIDLLMVGFGLLMIGLTLFVLFAAHSPIGQAFTETLFQVILILPLLPLLWEGIFLMLAHIVCLIKKWLELKTLNMYLVQQHEGLLS